MNGNTTAPASVRSSEVLFEQRQECQAGLHHRPSCFSLGGTVRLRLHGPVFAPCSGLVKAVALKKAEVFSGCGIGGIEPECLLKLPARLIKPLLPV